MNAKNRILLVILFSLFVMLFSNGCSRHLVGVIVETRFSETKSPVVGSLVSINSFKVSWPPPQFEPVAIGDGVFYTKMLCDTPISVFFAFPGQDWNHYTGSTGLPCEGKSTSGLIKTEWTLFSGPDSDDPKDVEYRIIVLPKLKKLTRDYFGAHTYD